MTETLAILFKNGEAERITVDAQEARDFRAALTGKNIWFTLNSAPGQDHRTLLIRLSDVSVVMF